MRLVPGHTLRRDLEVPQQVRAALDDAVDAGRAEAEGWARVHPTGSTNRFHRDTIASISTPPSGAQQAAELAELHEIAATRNEVGTAYAVALAKRAGWDAWEATIAQIGKEQGPDQARRAAALLDRAAKRTDAVSSETKATFDRQRPYEVDPTLTTVVPVPHGNASHPSGHASGAYAAAIVLASFVPERADELMEMAAEVAYSRLYGGVHFRSDVVVGARIASRIATDVLRRDAAGLPASN